MAENEIQSEEKKYGGLQWFLFVVVIPLVFSITVTLVILMVSGVNVFKEARKIGEKIPVFSEVLANKEDPTDKVNRLEQDIADLQAAKVVKDSTISSLEKKITSKENEIANLNDQIRDLRHQLFQDTTQKQQAETKLKEVVQTYENMTPKKAAAIITELQDEEATLILAKMDSDTVSAILQKMDPKSAAKYTSLLTRKP